MSREDELEIKQERIVKMMTRWQELSTSGADRFILIPAEEFHAEFLALSTDMGRDYGETS